MPGSVQLVAFFTPQIASCALGRVVRCPNGAELGASLYSCASPRGCALRQTIRLVGTGYLIVTTWLGLFAATLMLGPRLSPTLDDPRWGFVIAAVAIAPLLAPAFLRHVAPRIRTVRISDFLEVSLSEVSTKPHSLRALAEQLKAIPEQVAAPEYASMMVSHSAAIVEAIRDVRISRDEVLVVDLAEGGAWIPPNLYLLATLAERRTAVRAIAFVETRAKDGEFVCLCSPDDLVDALASRFPELRQAGDTAERQQQAISEAGFASAFFAELSTAYAQDPNAFQNKGFPLNSSSLLRLLGARANLDSVPWSTPLSEEAFRKVLRGTNAYLAAVEESQLASVVSRDRLAVMVARRIAEQSTA